MKHKPAPSDFHDCPSWTAYMADGNTGRRVRWLPRYREVGLIWSDGTGALQIMNYCPFCGSQLPTSLRDAWFEEMFRIWGDDFTPGVHRIPRRYRSDQWWREDHPIGTSVNK